MRTPLLRSAVLVPDAGDDLRRRVQIELTIVNKQVLAAQAAGQYDRMEPENRPSPVRQEWFDMGDYLWLPRAWGRQHAPDAIEDLPTWERKIRFESRVTLRDHQHAAVAAIVEGERMKEGILGMNVGRGKTVVSLHALSLLKTGPVLVVVPNGMLMAQWLERIEQVLSHVEGGVGQVGGGKDDWEGRGLVVGTIQTLALQDMGKSFYDYFETAIIDEGHTTAADKYSRVFWKFPGRRLVLTATPDRKDGLGKVLRLHAGPVLFVDKTTDLPLKVLQFIDTGEKSSWMNSESPYYWKQIVAPRLSQRPTRQAVAIDLVVRAIAKSRTVLVLGDYVKELEALADQATKKGLKVGLVIGKTKMGVRMEEIEGKQVTFATSSLAKVGLDYPPFDTLILLYPVVDKNMLQQAFGRIQRACSGKQDPVAVVLVDWSIPAGKKMGEKMRRVAHLGGYKTAGPEK